VHEGGGGAQELGDHKNEVCSAAAYHLLSTLNSIMRTVTAR
jgi:hypothetical protein